MREGESEYSAACARFSRVSGEALSRNACFDTGHFFEAHYAAASSCSFEGRLCCQRRQEHFRRFLSCSPEKRLGE